MKKDTADDIKPVDWETHVRQRPEMYFPTSNVDASEVSKAIKYSANILGAVETDFREMDGWSYFCADVDWIFESEFQFESIHQIFSGPGPFPEARQQNAFRCESLCLAFSSSVFTVSNGKVVVLKGAAPAEVLLKAHLEELSDWERVVGYKFRKDA